MAEFQEPVDRLEDIRAIVDMYVAGDLNSVQAMGAIGIASGRIERSEESLQLGEMVTKVAQGKAPASVLVAWIESL